jgi:hypothetical protein
MRRLLALALTSLGLAGLLSLPGPQPTATTTTTTTTTSAPRPLAPPGWVCLAGQRGAPGGCVRLEAGRLELRLESPAGEGGRTRWRVRVDREDGVLLVRSRGRTPQGT